MTYIIAATGHRPNKLSASEQQLRDFATDYLANARPDFCVSGMAMGWDLAFAEASLQLEIPLIAAIPFPNQASFWSMEQWLRWNRVLIGATHAQIISKTYSPKCFQRRNEWMVDLADEVLALWNGQPGGGTWNCLQYIQRMMHKPQVTNLWDRLEHGRKVTNY